ncbi:hypothetical protein NCS57_01087000 [Fusarium keratoplasticum]|uniref:Uncharacterized protein n=1 Tax=Fusarium keratoplasticum TaxID=1328300 RepID=A0ACC0QQR1_9HYPO|nr:hypothetical protein NCS57_01087000 [Fusarium keratoplasticum]KAI8661076.1 hypothetical protein NCS57_01087000 [Fusarium keratoplasticum]
MDHSDVHVIARHTVQSADLPVPISATSTNTTFPFLLGPLDHLGSPGIPVGVVWVYEPSSTCPKPAPIETLTLALSRLLDYYPHLTGRLHIDASSGIRVINQQETGIHLYEARCNTSLSKFYKMSTEELSLGLGDLGGTSVALMAPWEVSEESVQREPLLCVQHTRFACGSMALGIRLARVMAGAGGFLQLFRHLAELYRAVADDGMEEPTLKNPPHIMPFMVEEMAGYIATKDTPTASLHQPAGYSTERIVEEPALARDAPEVITPEAIAPACQVIGREIRFTVSELAALKASAMPPDGDSWVSTFSALSAYIWQRSQIARLRTQASAQGCGDLALQPCAFFTSVDFSSKISLPQPYFPSAVVTPSVQLPASELVDAPLWRVAKAIHDATRAVSPEMVRNLGNWVIAQPRKQDIRQTTTFGTNSVITTAWNKHSLYTGADLDIPPTIACVPITPTNLVDGLGFFLQPREGKGDIIVALALKQAVWENLDNDANWRVTTRGSVHPVADSR